MRQSIILFYLIIMFSSSSALWAKTADTIWWDEESGGRHIAASRGQKEGLRLYRGRFPDAEREMDLTALQASTAGGIWIKAPDGGTSTASLSADNESVAWDIPSQSGPSGIAGLYIVGMRLQADDLNPETGERVHYYAKYLMDVRNETEARDETTGQSQAPDVFLNDPERMPLEIGPFYEQDAKVSSLGAGFLESRRKQKLRILYKGAPLGNAKVSVITDDGWERTETTNPKGIFTILPVQSGEEDGKVLCAVFHRDTSTGECHFATLMLHVFTPVSEWKDRFLTFSVYASGAVCLSVLFVLYRINRRKKRDIKIMLEFEKRKIQEA